MTHALVVPLEYEAPGLKDFQFPGTFGVSWMDKTFWQMVIAAVLVIGLWLWMSHSLKVVPGKRQVAAEYVYNFVRNTLVRDVIGHDFVKWMPYLLALFSFVLINNWFGELFLFMFPTFSHVGYVYGLAIVTWFVYIIAGLKAQGPRYFLSAVLPKGVPWYLWWLIIPLEFLSTFITRPLTLSLRLFANMFAGHLIIMIFVVGGGFLLTYSGNPFYNVTGAVSVLFSFALFALELFVGFLQAYVFTVLSAQYVASSISTDH
ncbi:F0F1 ATP synthase subunit A [Acidipropionibacterium timonense]|uniref:F0F1 ATP synthase subunit A n=1 Tax=Acidipropionibacterium timonense TaxID=2161818 RepID=UPI001030CC93|nr:F0F1 ATP synthase subunit A [Acidipropionibacterium timonense]